MATGGVDVKKRTSGGKVAADVSRTVCSQRTGDLKTLIMVVAWSHEGTLAHFDCDVH